MRQAFLGIIFSRKSNSKVYILREIYHRTPLKPPSTPESYHYSNSKNWEQNKKKMHTSSDLIPTASLYIAKTHVLYVVVCRFDSLFSVMHRYSST